MNRFRSLPLVLAAGLLSSACGGAPADLAEPAVAGSPISVSLTAPPLGWNSWNTFAEAIDYNTIKAQADAMVSSGMKDAGYQYVNLDAGWWLGTRDGQGNITVDTSKWPGGMSAIADYIHSKGLKAGIYTDAGMNGCIYWWPTNGPIGPNTGAEGHYDQDFLQFSKWGFDYVKVDWCGGRAEGLNAQNMYTQLSASIDKAVAQTGRPMVLSVCEWGANQPWNWAPAISSLWRTSDDIIFFGNPPSMSNVFRNFDSAQHASAQSPGHYNDPDMLMVGMSGFNSAQNKTHISLWAISSAPLIAGNNLATMSSDTKAILTNRDMLSINQDALGKIPTKVSDQSGLQVYSKVLSGTGRRAVLLLNRNTSSGSITVRWSDLGLTAASPSVRNVWTGADLGAVATSYTASVAGQDSVLLLVSEAGNGNTLTVTKSGTGTGTVASSPAGITCGSTCTASYTSTTSVTLTATPSSTSTFTGWSGACSGSATTCTVAMSAARSVTASFAAGPISSISINAGGTDTGSFVADTFFSGGSTYSNTNTIDTSAISGTIPQDVFQTERYGEFTYAIPGLTAGNAYSVTLYFEESYLTAAGQRLFDVAINGTKVLTGFDIFAEAGVANKAVAKTFTATADGSGQVAIQFSKGTAENPKVCGIAIAPQVATCSASPSAPASLTATASSTSQIQLAWSGVTPPANCSVTYSVFRGGSQIATGLTTLSFSDTGLAPATAYSYTVRAVDSFGASASSITATATTLTPPDTLAPSAPTGLSASNITTTSVALAWIASTDNVGVVVYDIYRGSSLVVSSASASATVSSLSPGTTYSFTVRARDAAGNVSPSSSALSVTTTPASDITPPSAPANLTWASDGLTVSLTWSASTDDVGVASYELLYGSFSLGSFTDTVLTLIGFKPGTPYTFTVKARDAAGNVSVASNQVTVLLANTVDTTPPSAPTNLTTVSVTSSSITLRWTASTDDVGVVVYQVLANGNLAGTVTATTATVGGLSSGTAFSITVRALDAAGNVSNESQPLTVTSTL
jgi:chitodextrinase